MRSETPIYPGTTPPALRVSCIVGWNGREFRAIRLVHPRRRSIEWATYRDGEVVWLPPKRETTRWGQTPDWWRPEHPETYPARLPEPIEFRSRGQRASPEPAARDEEPSPRRRATWWLDAAAITYSPAGNISRDECEGRLLRAVSCAGVVSKSAMQERSQAERLAELAEAIANGLDVDDALQAVVPRFEATPDDIADWLTPMAWFAALDPPELRHKRRDAWSLTYRQRLIVWRSGTRPYSFSKIAEWHNRSAEAIRQQYGEAIDKAHRAANGRRPFPETPLRDHMADVRAGNRDARRRAGETV